MQTNTELLFFQGIFIGIVFGVPAGAIGALTIQRSLKFGFTAGFITGLGSTVVDVLYAFIGIFGITIIQDYLQQSQLLISIIGGIVIILMGISIFTKNGETISEDVSLKKYQTMFLSSFFIAICNPATILSFLTVFAVLNIETGMNTLDGVALATGICIGTCVWWSVLSGIAIKIRHSMADNVYKILYKVMGVILVVFGIAIIIFQYIG